MRISFRLFFLLLFAGEWSALCAESVSGDQKVNFTRHIAPILFRHCAGCHRPGEAAPFSLLSYDDARKRDRQIVEVTAKRIMPPWLPEPGYGHFIEERRLSDAELKLLADWVDQGSAEGNAAGESAD